MRSRELTAVHVAVRDALADLKAGDLVLVACSGGPDSLALAAAAASLAPAHVWRAGAVVVDHGWSASASAASADAARTCRDLGLDPVELVAVDASGPGGPEAAARTARYAALQEASDRLGAAAVLLGHTLNDQAETVLLGLTRGSGARSLSGMRREVRHWIRRPLLDLTRADTLAACAALGLDPWLDPANDDPRYLRVRVRRLADQLEEAIGPGVAAALARTADMLWEDEDALAALASRFLTQHDPGGSNAVPRSLLLQEPTAIRHRVLLRMAQAAGSPAGSLSRRHALAMDAVLLARHAASTDLPGGVRARMETPDQGGAHLVIRTCGDDQGEGMGSLN